MRRIELMLADGTVVMCSRTQHQELFGLAMGGYGLVGIILKLEVEMVENVSLQPTFEVMSSTSFSPRFITTVNDPNVRMAYGRLSVTRNGFLDSALLVSFRPAPRHSSPPPPAGSGGIMSSVSREIYRAQLGSEAGKRARWFAETVAGPTVLTGTATRNRLLNEPVASLASRDRSRTDILHEYFVPAEGFNEFIGSCQELIPRSRQDMLNITLRYVAADETSVLSFAPSPRVAGVMSFAQEIAPEAEADMIQLTEALIDRAAAVGGAFYLPYRLHARRDQVAEIYPRAQQFTARKRHYDPGLVFRNAMWSSYFAHNS